MKKLLLASMAIAVLLLTSIATKADPASVVIDSSVGQYSVTTVTGTFEDLSSLLMSQVWWGNNSLAAEFANLVGGSLGFQSVFARDDVGPLFAICSNDCIGNTGGSFPYQGSIWTTGLGLAAFATDNREHTYAVATSVPEPATLGLLSLGLAGLAFARRRRQI